MRAVIADESVLLREGLARLLAEEGVETVALVDDPDALEKAVAEHEPDVALVDIRMPPTFTHEGRRPRSVDEWRAPSSACSSSHSRSRPAIRPSSPATSQSGSANCSRTGSRRDHARRLARTGGVGRDGARPRGRPPPHGSWRAPQVRNASTHPAWLAGGRRPSALPPRGRRRPDLRRGCERRPHHIPRPSSPVFTSPKLP